MENHWLFREVTLPMFELLYYIWLAMMFAIIAAIVFQAYIRLEKRASSFLHPSPDKQNNPTHITNDQKDKKNC